jgi:3-deoxy-D-manno-octulosonic-acid transferase
MNIFPVILYNLFIQLYAFAIRIASIWNKKAKFWIEGRKAFPSFEHKEKTIWMHCASLGEFEQGRPVLENLKKSYPEHSIVLSFFSPSGYQSAQKFYGADQIIYLPLDTAFNAKEIISRINPGIVLWVKYEYWYHYLTEIKKSNIPLLLISGIFRENQPFFKFYGHLWRKILESFTHFFVQNSHSKFLLESIGFNENITISGDTRFDRVIEIAENKAPVEGIDVFKDKNRLLVAGSTWKEDVQMLAEYAKKNPSLKFIIAPHEISTHSLKETKNFFSKAVLYSELTTNSAMDKTSNVLIIDNIGMLSRLYAYADISYIGGGFNKSGIHNTLEAAVYGKPVIFGPHYKKFEEANRLINEGGGASFKNYSELEKILDHYLGNSEKIKTAGINAKEIVYGGKGATEKISAYIRGIFS